MTWLTRVVSAAVVVLLVGVSPVAAQFGSGTRIPGLSANGRGRLEGRVVDEKGSPMSGVVVSILGATPMVGVTDTDGRFTVDGLGSGVYRVQAHRPGFVSVSRETTLVDDQATAQALISMRRVSPTMGAVGTGGHSPMPLLTAGLAAATESELQPDDSLEDSDDSAVIDDHSEKAWRLRHADRSALKDTTDRTTTDRSDDGSTVDAVLGVPARLASALFAQAPSGQVNLLTMSAFDSPGELFSAPSPMGFAYLSLSAPVGPRAGWTVNGVVTQGSVSSWILGGSFVNEWPSAHLLGVDLSYATQSYPGPNPVALAAVRDERRNVGALQVSDRWTVSRHVAVEYGTRYARYDYVEGAGLLSPRMSVTLSPRKGTSLRALAWQRMTAPGAEAFLPPRIHGLWLPPERTFSSVEPAGRFDAETARRMELALEHTEGNWIIGVRGFAERVDNQIVTIFGVHRENGPRSDLGHYLVANAGQADTAGWGISLSRPVAGRIRGSIAYTITQAHWSSPPSAVMAALAASATQRMGSERFHDLTTWVETDIPETATRVCVVYKVNTAFAKPQIDVPRLGTDVRFDVQVNQVLPFAPLAGTQWEVLVAVRNLFHEADTEASVYDELLVVRPPKRIVGGLTVRF